MVATFYITPDNKHDCCYATAYTWLKVFEGNFMTPNYTL